MTSASSVVSPSSSGLPPHPTVKSHWSSSQAVHPCGEQSEGAGGSLLSSEQRRRRRRRRSPTSVTASSALPLPCKTSHAAAVAFVNGQVLSTRGTAEGVSSCAEGAQEPAQAPRAPKKGARAT